MIVARTFYSLVPDKRAEAIALVKEMLGDYSLRVYTPDIGATFGTLCIEMEFKSLADFEESRAAFVASPKGQIWSEKWAEVFKQGAGHGEVWTLHD